MVAEVINGVRLAWEEVGRGVPLVLVHGIAESRRAWTHQLASLAERFHVVAMDVRGFGESEPGTSNGRLADYGDDVAALVRRLGGGPAVVVGFSMGGVIVQRFALDHPAEARAIVIAASSSVVSRRAAADYLERAELAETKGVEAVRQASVEDAAQCFTVSPPEVVEAYREIRRGGVRDARGFAAAAHAMASLRDKPLTPELAGIRCPALVVTGERDVFCPPRASEIIAGALLGARLEIVPRVGHCLHWEDAEGFNRLVLDFLSGV